MGKCPRGVSRDIDDGHGALEERKGCDDAALGIGGKGSAVEDEFVVAADLIDEDQGHLEIGRQARIHPPTLQGLARVPGGCRWIEDHRRVARADLCQGVDAVIELPGPGVFADRQANSGAQLRHIQRIVLVPGNKMSLLVKDVVGGKQRLGTVADPLAPGQDHRGVL